MVNLGYTEHVTGILHKMKRGKALGKNTGSGLLWLVQWCTVALTLPALSLYAPSLDLLADVQYAFGLPFYPAYEGQFSREEKSLSLKIMQYLSNFIRSG